MANSMEAGGFLTPTLPSPPPSARSTTTSILPHPRSHALRPGSSKESAFVSFVEGRLLAISGRFERRFLTDDASGVHGSASSSDRYQNFSGLARDLGGVVDTIWVSGTPSLQIPLLLSIADSILKYIDPFPFAPRATFELLDKLDLAFSSLLEGTDPETGGSLSGFETGRSMTITEKVRLRSILERSRVQVVKAGSGESISQVENRDITSDTDTDMDFGYNDGLEEQDDWSMETARVYEKTLVDLGSALDQAPQYSSS